jgi:hypothetical protein
MKWYGDFSFRAYLFAFCVNDEKRLTAVGKVKAKTGGMKQTDRDWTTESLCI